MSAALETARQEWEEGYRRVQAEAGNRVRHERLLAGVDAITAELRRRLGQTFTLAELVEAYAGAERWSRDVLAESGADVWPSSLSAVEDAAFFLYSRGATDFRP